MFNDAPCLAGGVAGVNDRGRFRLASGLCSVASARGPSWFRVRPVAQSLEFIHYNSSGYLFSSAQATRRAKSTLFSSLGSAGSADALENVAVFLSCLPQQSKLSKPGTNFYQPLLCMLKTICL